MVGCTVDQFMLALRCLYSPARALYWSGCLRIGMARRTWVRRSRNSVRVRFATWLRIAQPYKVAESNFPCRAGRCFEQSREIDSGRSSREWGTW